MASQPWPGVFEGRACDVVVSVVRHFDLDGSRRPALQSGVRIARNLLTNSYLSSTRTFFGGTRASKVPTNISGVTGELVPTPLSASPKITNREHSEGPLPHRRTPRPRQLDHLARSGDPAWRR